jgi:hypothetical protein
VSRGFGWVLGAASLLCLPVEGDTRFKRGEWEISFQASDASLRLTHAASGTEIDGTMSFMGPKKATDAQADATETWTLIDSRDGVPERLALADAHGNIQGYLTFQDGGPKLDFLFYHRTAVAYRGMFLYDGTIKYRDDAFSASTCPAQDERVLQLASGDPDSLLNDTLFSPSADEALYIRAPGGLQLESGEKGFYSFKMVGQIQPHGEAGASVSILRDYYRSRWVPYYAPIDRTRSPRPPTGWMSWNIYFDQAGSRENLAEARLGAKYLKPFGLEYWSIESWQGNSPKLPVANFHNMDLEYYEPQFPEGMKWLAGEIRKLGFRPGLWMAPFGTGNTNFYQAHKEWFLHRQDGRPISCWNGRFTLDPTVPAARDHLKKIFDVASHDWGYEFFKIDGMSGRGPSYGAHLYERPDIRACFADPKCPNPFELCVRAFREGIGPDRVFLACQGHFTGAEAAYADASRTGADIVHPNQPVKWHNLLLQARCTINQIFTHNIVFWADPDCMMVGQNALDIEQARVETTIVALPGQMMFAGDKLGELAPDRIRLIQQSLPVCDIRPGNLYPQFGHLPIWNLSIKRPFGAWHVVAFFNWSDEEQDVPCAWPEIGEDAESRFACWEFWTEKWLGVNQEALTVKVPARSVRLVAMQPYAARPQFLTSDRHITQGGVELKDQVWAEDRLTTTVNVIGGFPATFRFLIPESFRCSRVSVPNGVKMTTRFEAEGRILAVTVSAEATRDIPVTLEF